MNIACTLTKAALTFRDRPAVSQGTQTLLNYGVLSGRVSQIAGALRTRFRLQAGDRVALVMNNCPEYIELLYAIWHAGLTAVPINAKLHTRELAYILGDCGARLCCATPDLVANVAPLCGEVTTLESVISTTSEEYAEIAEGPAIPLQDAAPDSVAWLFYTSGTTGRPKGAMLSHRNLLAMTLSYYADIDTVTEHDCIIHAAPLSHGSGLYCLPYVAKAANQIIPKSGGFDIEELAELIAAYSGVSAFFAPTMLTRLVAHPAAQKLDPAHMKTIVYGGGPMYVEDLKHALALFGPKFVQIFGQGESPMTITALSRQVHADSSHPRWLERLGSAGIARSDVEVRVVDAQDHDVPAGQIGEIIARGDVVMRGYWNNPQATTETLRGGWLHTGDLGVFDANGFLTLKDRSKDLIISGGSNIYSREIEEVLHTHPGVFEVAVIGRAHREWGEEVVAFVVPRPQTTVTSEELDRLCLSMIARFKRPRAYFFIDALPKNNYGKVLKTELRRQISEQLNTAL